MSYDDLSQAIWDKRQADYGDNLAVAGNWVTTERDGGGLLDIWYVPDGWRSIPTLVALIDGDLDDTDDRWAIVLDDISDRSETIYCDGFEYALSTEVQEWTADINGGKLD